MSVLNLHEEERQKPENWIPIGWMPVYDEKLATKRPGKGYESHAARKARLFHDCFCVPGMRKRKGRKILYGATKSKDRHDSFWAG